MKKLLFIFLCFLMTAITILSIIFIKPISFEKPAENKQCFMKLWHLDMFEGGTGSRGKILKELADKYNKITGNYISVSIETEYSVKDKFKNNIYPDIISFSSGLNLPYSKIKKIANGKGIGSYNGEIYAIPYLSGGYVYIKRKDVVPDGLIISTQKHTFPYLACYFSSLNMAVKEEIESSNAIYSFYRNKNYALIGTQRDLFRLQNKGIDVDVVPLDGFNDLYQYLSVLSDERYSESVDFVRFVENECKNSDILRKIGLISVDGYKKSKNSEVLAVFDGHTFKNTIDIFMSQEKLDKLRNLSKNANENCESIKNFVKIIDIM